MSYVWERRGQEGMGRNCKGVLVNARCAATQAWLRMHGMVADARHGCGCTAWLQMHSHTGMVADA